MNSWIDKITHDPLRHWHRFLKGFAIFMVGVTLWYSDLALVYFGISDAAVHSYSDPSKIIALVFLFFGTIISAIGYLQILVCRLLPSRTGLPRN
jgi:putative flippase GtrA